jgi:hypothetical protein
VRGKRSKHGFEKSLALTVLLHIALTLGEAGHLG